MRLLILVLLSVCALTDAFVSLMCSKPTLLPRPRRPCVTGEKWPVEKYTRKDAIEQKRLEGRRVHILHEAYAAGVQSRDDESWLLQQCEMKRIMKCR